MPFTHRGRPALRRFALGPTSWGPEPAPSLVPNNNFFKELMQTFIERAQALAAQAAPGVEVKDNTNRPLKPRNPDLYYSHFHMECYYFYQQCENYFEITGSLGHKRVPFTASSLKDHILNQWQQHKTRIQHNRLVSITWDEFKAILRESLGESNVCVGHV